MYVSFAVLYVSVTANQNEPTNWTSGIRIHPLMASHFISPSHVLRLYVCEFEAVAISRISAENI